MVGSVGVPDPKEKLAIWYVLLNASDPVPLNANLRPHSPRVIQLPNNAVVKPLSAVLIVTVTLPDAKDQEVLVEAPKLIAELWNP